MNSTDSMILHAESIKGRAWAVEGGPRGIKGREAHEVVNRLDGT